MTMGVFLYLERNTGDLALARTVAVNTLVCGELFYLFNCRKLDETVLGRVFFSNRFALLVSGILVMGQLVFTYVPLVQRWFDTAPMRLVYWLVPVTGGLLVLLIVELEKRLTRKYRNRREE